MAGKELKIESSILQDFYDAEEREEDALSLRDLPLNSISSDNWNNDEDRSLLFDHADFFEFVSQDSTASSIYPSENVIFCGKLISRKAEKDQTLKEIKRSSRNTKKCRLLSWKSLSFNKSRTSSFSKNRQAKKPYKTCKNVPLQSERKYNESKYLASPMRSRWYLSARFPMQMELSDIKTRQSKMSSPAKMFQCSESEMVIKRTKSPKDFWGLLRVVLGCKGLHASSCLHPISSS